MTNPLFEIAIRGDETRANEIHKFFISYDAINTRGLSFESKDLGYFAVRHPNSGDILIKCAGLDKIYPRKIVTLSEAEKIMQEWENSLRQPKQKRRKHKIHKSNCVNKVRFTATDQLGNTITVCGKYAFEWTININKNGMVIQTSFESRRKALNELRKLTGKKIQ